MSDGDFPRGWTYSNAPGATTNAAVTIPGIPGVTHVVTAVNASCVEIYEAASQQTIAVILYAPDQMTLGWISLVTSAADGYISGQINWTGDKAAPEGSAVTAAFQNAGANGVYQNIELQGYDI